jgi:hypothetical protein
MLLQRFYPGLCNASSMDFATAKKHGLRDVFLYEPDSTGFAAMARLHSLSTPGSRILDSEERCVHASR